MPPISQFLAGNAPDLGLMSVPARAVVAAGDLVVFRESGGVSPYDPVLGPASEANNTLGSKTLLAPSLAPGGANYIMRTIGPAAALLSNGNVVTCYSGNGTTATTNLNFRITNKVGGVIVPQTVALAATGVYPHSVYATSTGFVILFGNVSNTLAMTVYSNAGAQVLAATDIISDAASHTDQATFTGCLLANGNLAIAYRRVTSNDCVLKVFSQAAAQVGATITVAAGASPTFQAMAQAPVSGDIVLSYFATSYRVARYTAAGAQVGSVLAFGPNSGVFAGAAWTKHCLAVFSDDRVAVMHADSTSTSSPALTFLSATNTAVTTITAAMLGSIAYSSSFPVIGCDGTTLYFHQQTTNAAYTAGTWRSDGGGRTAPASFACTALSSSSWAPGNYGYARLLPLGAAGFALLFMGNTGGPTYAAQTLYIPADRNSANTSVVTLHADSAVARAGSIALPVAEGVVYIAYAAGISAVYTDPSAAVFAFPRAAIFGVAQESAAAGDLVTVATKGTFTLPAAQQGGISTNFDGRAYGIAGNKGTLAGASIVLLGLTG